jgi:hypothetical protein
MFIKATSFCAVPVAMAAIVCFTVPVAASAADFGPGSDRFFIAAGWFPSTFSTKVRVDNKNLDLGDKIDLENDLGLKDSSNAFYGAFTWRFFKRHRLAVSYYDFHRGNSGQAEGDLEIGDKIIPVGAKVNTTFDVNIFPIAYSYSFVQGEKVEFSGSIGVHWSDIRFGVNGKGFLGEGGEVNEFDDSAKASASAPLPLLGLGVDYWITPRWLAIADGQYFQLSLSDDTFDYKGSLTNIRIATEYVPYKGLGIGIAYNWFAMDVDVEDNKWYGRLEYEYYGPQIYATYRFK